MSWIEELDEDLFKAFILEQYIEWLEDFAKLCDTRLETYPEEHHEALKDRAVEIYNEVSKVVGMC